MEIGIFLIPACVLTLDASGRLLNLNRASMRLTLEGEKQ
jgi:hypothetical protein